MRHSIGREFQSLAVQGITDPSYLKKPGKWQNFYKTKLPVRTMKSRLDFLFAVSVNRHAYSTLHE